jgi:DNA-directed RNA polymerase subunit RPC12/RpoP
MLAASDHRSFSSSDDRYQHCLRCGKEIVVLPNDRRGGTCFDCLSLLGADPEPCPECGAEISNERREAGCGRCGWVALDRPRGPRP